VVALIQVAASVAMMLAAPAAVRSQVSSTQRTAEPAFEVASIRRNTSTSGRVMMDGAGDRFRITNASLRILIVQAYELLDEQLVDGPGWMNNDRFDIVAVRGGAPFDHVPAMLRTLSGGHGPVDVLVIDSVSPPTDN
jgi:hypothetical protein